MKQPAKHGMIEFYEKQFAEQAKNLVWILQQGGGCKNIHVLEAIRGLEYAYLILAAYTQAYHEST